MSENGSPDGVNVSKQAIVDVFTLIDTGASHEVVLEAVRRTGLTVSDFRQAFRRVAARKGWDL